MIRLREEQWERIRDHFPEEKIVDGRPGRKPIPTRVCSKRWCGFDGDGAAVFPFDAALPFVADEFAFSQET